MDTVYGTKKYFQSLSAGSDIYRSSACRAMTNDYSYQNTLGRRSTLGAYYHMNKQPSFTNEHSLGSQYGGGGGGGAYSTWGMWRDGRNIAPSTFSAKPHHPHTKTKSFSIILSTAAFIVLLAVISIAGLAFYFSSIKSNMEDTVIGFEGSFRIAKGDLFTTGLKYNHTTTYKQKVEYYKRFVERSLTDNALQPIRVDVAGFGDGPLIKVSFRTYLDVRKLPQNIHSVEEYIKESLFLETTALKSLYRSLRIDPESVEVKRILDEQLVKSASLSRDTQMNPTSQTQLEKRLLKKGGLLEKPTLKTLPNSSSKTKLSKPPHSVDDEPDVDVENAPVIQGSFEGSFEITKTDADITQKKASPTKAYSNTPKSVTPFPLRVKPKKPAVEKVAAKTTRAEDPTTTTTTTKSTTSTTTTTTSTTTTTPKPTTTTTLKTTTTTLTTTPPPPPPPTTTPSAPTYSQTNSPSTTTVEVPKLDASLFTSAPVLDTQPWRPIRGPGSEIFEPAIQIATQTENVISITTPYEPVRPPPMIQAPASYDPYPSGFFSKPNFNKPENREDTNVEDLVYYHGYSGPVFMPGIDGIEPLGAAHVKPHPLPNPLIDDVVIPAFKPLNPTLGTNGKIPFAIEAGDEKFEHLGGGVIVKKHDNESSATTKTTATTPTTTKTTQTSSTTAASTSTTSIPSSSIKPKNSSKESQITHQIGEFLMDLLNLPDEDVKNTTDLVELKLESRIEPDSEERPNFMNLKEIILQRNRGSTTTSAESSAPSTSSTTTTTTTKSPGTKRNRIRPSRPSKPVGTLDDSSLFPSQSKWEFVNGSSPHTYGHTGSMRKVFNKTLQAWVSEDVEKAENLTLNDIKTRINNATNIQDISLIFDTLASKLGITHSMPTKIPPFSHNKLKISQRNDTKIKLITTTTTSMPTTTTTQQTRPSTTTTRRTSTSTSTTTTPTYIEYSQVQMKDPIMPTFRPLSPMLPAEVIEGEAEVEVIDPNKYEEMLKSSQVPLLSLASTTELPRLVTLLPVRSNSGIRTFRPLIDSQAEGRRLTTPSEAIVKSGIHVTV